MPDTTHKLGATRMRVEDIQEDFSLPNGAISRCDQRTRIARRSISLLSRRPNPTEVRSASRMSPSIRSGCRPKGSHGIRRCGAAVTDLSRQRPPEIQGVLRDSEILTEEDWTRAGLLTCVYSVQDELKTEAETGVVPEECHTDTADHSGPHGAPACRTVTGSSVEESSRQAGEPRKEAASEVSASSVHHHGKQNEDSQPRLHPSLALKQARDHPLMVRFHLGLAFVTGGSIEKAFRLATRTRDTRLSDSEPLSAADRPESGGLAETAGMQSEETTSSFESETEHQSGTDLLLRVARQHPRLARFWEAAAGLLLGAREEQVMKLREQREMETIMREGRAAVPAPAFAVRDTQKTPFQTGRRVGLLQRVARQNPNIASFWETLGALLTGKLKDVKKMQTERKRLGYSRV